MKVIVFLLAFSLVGLFTSCKEKKKKPVLAQKKVEVVEVPKPKEEPVIVEEPVVPEKQANYHLVGGCFRIRSNAERFNAKLLNEGYDSQILPFYNLSMVTYNSYETRAEAQVALNRIVREPGKSKTWVYPVR